MAPSQAPSIAPSQAPSVEWVDSSCLAGCDATLLAALDEVESFEQLCSVAAPLFASGCGDACRGTADEEEIRPILESCGLRTPTPCARRLPAAPFHT